VFQLYLIFQWPMIIFMLVISGLAAHFKFLVHGLLTVFDSLKKTPVSTLF
jgi:hypothetical protein